MTLTVMTPLKVYTQVGQYIPQKTTESSCEQSVTLVNTHSASLQVTITSALVLNEDSRSVSAGTTIGTVTGGSYPDTGATSQNLLLASKSSVELVFTHSMDNTPEDALGNAMDYQVQTPVAVVTITEEGGVNITDIGPTSFPMGTIIYGPYGYTKLSQGGLVFPSRKSDVTKALMAFFGGTAGISTLRLAKMLDWIENGGSLDRIIEVVDVLSALDAGYPAALTANYSTFADLAAATTAVNATNTHINSLRTLLTGLAIK